MGSRRAARYSDGAPHAIRSAPRVERAIFLGLFILASLLTLTRLDNGSLWQDEAQTALIARTVLDGGIPLGTDGRNFFSQELGAEYGAHYVWRWHTWFPFYLLAAFFGIFGESTWNARLPFALFGIATVLMTYRYGRNLVRSERAAAVAGLLLCTSVPFLVLSRQCRYYSVAAFFSVAALYAYRRIVDGGGRGAGGSFVAASVLLFHTHYAYAAALLLGVLADAAICNRAFLRRVGVLVGVSVMLELPWIAWLSTMPYGERYTLFDLARANSILVALLDQLASHAFPVAVLVVPIALLLWPEKLEGRERPGRDDAIGNRPIPLLLFLVSTLTILALSAPAPFFRYLAPVLPICCLLLAWIVEAAARRHRAAGIAVLAGLLVFQPLDDYADELIHEFDGPVDGIVRYLDEHARPEDVVAISYEDLPIKFYTKLRVLGGLTGEPLGAARTATWIIVRKYSISTKDRQVKQFLLAYVDWEEYDRIELESPDTPFQNRESPQEHRFRTAKDEDPVVLFHRVASQRNSVE